MLKKQLFIIVIFLAVSKCFGFERTLYVDRFENIIGSYAKEEKLLSFAKKNNFSTLILYGLNKIDKKFSLTEEAKNTMISHFISTAKTKFGILEIGVSGEAASYFTNVIEVYNNSRTKASEKFDIYNLEYEYWSKKASGDAGYYCVNYLEENAIPCGRIGSFNFFIENLKELKKLTKNSKHKIKVEAYVGYYTQTEIAEISKFCDRLLIHAFAKDPKLCLATALKNLTNLYNTKSKVKTSILLSTRMVHLGSWLKHDTLSSGEAMFVEAMNKKNSKLIKYLNLDGFSYHTYSDLEKSLNYYSYTRN